MNVAIRKPMALMRQNEEEGSVMESNSGEESVMESVSIQEECIAEVMKILKEVMIKENLEIDTKRY